MMRLKFAVLAITLSVTGASAAHAQQNPANTPSQNSSPNATQDKSPDNAINGKWHFVFNIPSGDREFDADFTVDAEGKVSGTFGKSPATGTFKDGHLQMAFDATSEEGETAQLQLDGKFEDTATLTGSWSFSSYDGNFKATHPKP
jgi:hypothetical protein